MSKNNNTYFDKTTVAMGTIYTVLLLVFIVSMVIWG